MPRIRNHGRRSAGLPPEPPNPAQPRPLPPSGPPPFALPQGRERLRELHTAILKTEDRLATIAAAQQRAGDELEAARHQAAEAEEQLAGHHFAAAPAALAEAYISGEAIAAEMPETRNALNQAEAQQRRAQAILAALDAEQRQYEMNLRLQHLSRAEAAAEVIYNSAGIATLLAELDGAWVKIRSLRRALMAMHARTMMPQPLMDRIQAVPVLDWEWDTSQPCDHTIAQLWTAAIEQLLEDPETPLPGEEPVPGVLPGEEPANGPSIISEEPTPCPS
jgi:hypothetical protein